MGMVRLLFIVILAGLITGCDGGGSGSNGNPVTPPVEPPLEPPVEPPSDWPADNAVTIGDKEWLQPADFLGYRYDQVNAVCSGPDGECSGSLQGSTFDLTGYGWASIMEVSSLFNAYGVEPPFTAPFQERNHPSKEPFIEDFAVTAIKCFGDCPVDISYVAGLVRDPAPTGVLPYDPYASFLLDSEPEQPEIYFNNTSKDENEGEPFNTSERGVWFWKPAIPSIIVANDREWLQPDLFQGPGYSWGEVAAVCPDGVCSGTLPETTVDLTGFFWASSIDVSDLFNAYSDKEEFFLDFRATGIFIYNDGDDDNVPTTVGMTREPPRPLDPEDPSDVERINVAGVIPQYEQIDSIVEERFFTDDSVVPGKGEYGYGIWFYRQTGR